MSKHGGRVLVHEKSFLKWLGFEGGKIHYIGRPEDYLGTVVILIEHPDMPEVKEGDIVQTIDPTYYLEDIRRIEPKTGLRTKLRRVFQK